MAGVQALGGALNVTLNDATSKGAYMPDGSLRVTDTPGQGICDASGALRIASNVANGVYSPHLDSIRYSDGASDAAVGVQFKDGAIRMVSGQDAATTAWVAAVVAAGGTVSSARKVLINNLIVGLKADGVWTKLDRLWILAAENEASALTDLVGDTLATAVSSPTFTADQGYAGDGVTSYIDTNFNPSTQGVNYLLDSASAFAWDLTSRAADQKQIFGSANGANRIGIYPRFTGDVCYCRINDDAGSLSNASSQGFFLGNRSSSTARQLYKDGSSVGTYGSEASTGISNLNFYICGINNNGLPETLSTDTIGVVGLGGSLNGTEATAVYNRIHTYMQAVAGVP
jgi:hypothetical protein